MKRFSFYLLHNLYDRNLRKIEKTCSENLSEAVRQSSDRLSVTVVYPSWYPVMDPIAERVRGR